ncbi:MAG TPA: hypothetical protein VGJ42_04040 [Nitrososphaera sp.]|jgi:hypothetical protein
MHPHTKKVVMMTAISLGILVFAYMIPVYVVPVALGLSHVAGCTDYGCANSTFSKCGGFSSSEGDSTSFIGSWTRGMRGMLCMIGLDTSASLNASAVQITLNKV